MREEDVDKSLMKRVAANDRVALCVLGKRLQQNGDYDGAIKYLTKAAELGDAGAHFNLAYLYSHGEGVEKDDTKGLFHLEEAAISGHPNARHNLAFREGEIGRSLKHWIIAANLGFDESINKLKECYKDGCVSKEDFAAALRAHHVAVKAMKSPQREAAEKADAAGEIRWG